MSQVSAENETEELTPLETAQKLKQFTKEEEWLIQLDQEDLEHKES